MPSSERAVERVSAYAEVYSDDDVVVRIEADDGGNLVRFEDHEAALQTQREQLRTEVEGEVRERLREELAKEDKLEVNEFGQLREAILLSDLFDAIDRTALTAATEEDGS